MALTTGRICKTAAGASAGTQQLTDVTAGSAVADVDASPLPANGAIAALTFSNPPTQAECQALRDQCENLRDALANANTTINALLARLRVTGGHALIAD